MLSNIVMKNLLFAAWKNSSRHKIGQFEYNTYFIQNHDTELREYNQHNRIVQANLLELR